MKKVRLMLIKRYGKGFPQECVNDNCVNPKVSRQRKKNKKNLKIMFLIFDL